MICLFILGTTGQWTNWTSTPCNTTCGEGYKKVTRGCIDPKTRNITDSCVGENVRYEKCDSPVCKYIQKYILCE